MANDNALRVKSLSLDKKVEILTTSVDPIATGNDSSKGSLILFKPTGSAPAKMFQRYGALTTDWQEVGVSQGSSSAVVSDYVYACEVSSGAVPLVGSAWNIRNLNSVAQSSGSGIVLVGDTITVDAGSYRVTASAFAGSGTGASTLAIVDVTDGVTPESTPTAISDATRVRGTSVSGPAVLTLSGALVMSASRQLQLWHYSTVASFTGGSLADGVAATFNLEKVVNMDQQVGMATARVYNSSTAQSVAASPSSSAVSFNHIEHQTGITVRISDDNGGAIGSLWSVEVELAGVYLVSALFSIGPVTGTQSGCNLFLYKNNASFLSNSVREGADANEVTVSLQTVISLDVGDILFLKASSLQSGPTGTLKDFSLARVGSISNVTVQGVQPTSSGPGEYYLQSTLHYTGSANTLAQSVTIDPSKSTRLKILCKHKSGTIPQIRLNTFSTYYLKRVFNAGTIDGEDLVPSYIQLGLGDSSYTETVIDVSTGSYRRALQQASYRDVVDNVISMSSFELRDSSTPITQINVYVGSETVAEVSFLFSGENGVASGAGATGLQGVTGLIGLAGEMGLTGLPGAGFTGLQGSTGTAGGPGSTGPQGLTGLQGYTGLGLPGSQGETGVGGPQGPQGVTGPSGGGGGSSAYVHTQTVASTTWSVTHDLGYFPIIQVWDDTNSVVLCEILHTSTTVATLTFNVSLTGGARCI